MKYFNVYWIGLATSVQCITIACKSFFSSGQDTTLLEISFFTSKVVRQHLAVLMKTATWNMQKCLQRYE